ncbi:Yop proteins translocation protein R [Gammaproteobacteria bacterium]
MADAPDPFGLVLWLGLLALTPFLVVMGTSFIKLVVVFSLLRNAMGIQQIPPNIAMQGLALVLTFYIMAPVLFDAAEILKTRQLNLMKMDNITQVVEAARTPWRDFLIRHCQAEERAFFLATAQRLWGKRHSEGLSSDHLLVLIPAFTVSELTNAFQIGFLLYLPFLVIDLIVSNILLAMGMMMVSPMTISLPFKILLFVLVDGWTRLTHGLVLGYVGS